MIAQLAIFAVSLILLWKSSDWLVDSACGVARKTGLSEFTIGAFIIGFGTSLPELLVSCISSVQNNDGIALGNVFGSNIFNISCILGISGMLCSLKMKTSLLLKSCFSLSIAQGMAWLCAADRCISRIECVMMLCCFGLLLKMLSSENEQPQSQAETGGSITRNLAVSLGSLAVLAISSKFLVSSSIFMADWLGMPEMVVGMTVVATGTSLPELASSVAAARKGKGSLIVGNIIGSNFFNVLAVLGLSGLLKPYVEVSCFGEIGLSLALGISVALLSVHSQIFSFAVSLSWLICFLAYLHFSFCS